MKILLLRHWFTASLSILGLISPAQIGLENLLHMKQQPQATIVLIKTSHKKEIVKAHKTHRHMKAKAPKIEISGLRYSYMLSGQALCDGAACSNVKVEIRVTSEAGTQIRNVHTDANGIYQISLSLVGHPSEPVSFEITALTPDMQKLNLEGRQILTDGSLVQINAPLHFVR